MSQRIVECQGPIQLVTAVAVLRQRDRERARSGVIADADEHLIITELAAPAGQEAGFVRALEQMAATLRPWRSVARLRLTDRLALEERLAAGEHIDSLSGIALPDVSEVLVVREWQPDNQALLLSFPHANKIGFGDAIGIYLAPSFMRPQADLRPRAIASRAKQELRRLFNRGAAGGAPRPELPHASLDCYYLTLPDAFDPVPIRDVRLTDTALLREVMNELRPLLPHDLVRELGERVRGRRLVVVGGSNFSEQGVMTTDDELAAYVEHLASQGLARSSLVLLKPHPRDRADKAERLVELLRPHFDNVYALTDRTFYLPLETLVLELTAHPECLGVDVCTYSSACLASRYVLGLEPRIGFGPQLVAKYFQRRFVTARLAHEQQLQAACAARPAQWSQ
jgi:Alpha-2,8-polysialyltransferase (POLYST)